MTLYLTDKVWSIEIIKPLAERTRRLLAPIGAYIQYLDESQGATRSFTIETVIQATLLMTTTGMGLIFALKRMTTQHRQWMIRSYAVAFTFLVTRFIIGVAGLDHPFDWTTVETVVWACTASSLLVGDLANQVYDLRTARPRPVRARAARTAAASAVGHSVSAHGRTWNDVRS